jgi:hypothetical protein
MTTIVEVCYSILKKELAIKSQYKKLSKLQFILKYVDTLIINIKK